MNALLLEPAPPWKKVLLFTPDVPLNMIDSDWIYSCMWDGIVQGRGNGAFEPNALLNRAEVAKLARKVADER